MQPTHRSRDPIGSTVAGPLLTTSAGMTVTANRASASQEPVDFKGYFKILPYPPNSVIYRTAEAMNRVLLVKSGRVRLMHVGKDGTRAVTALLKPGDLFGEAFRPDNATEDIAVAAGQTEVWALEGQDFRAQLEARPALALEVFRAYASRVRDLHQRVLGLTFKEVPARLADTLVRLAQGHGEPCVHGGQTDLKGVTQQDLADLVGASRSFVSTLVNEMKRDGLLGNVGRTLCVRDTPALQRLAARDK